MTQIARLIFYFGVYWHDCQKMTMPGWHISSAEINFLILLWYYTTYYFVTLTFITFTPFHFLYGLCAANKFDKTNCIFSWSDSHHPDAIIHEYLRSVVRTHTYNKLSKSKVEITAGRLFIFKPSSCLWCFYEGDHSVPNSQIFAVLLIASFIAVYVCVV